MGFHLELLGDLKKLCEEAGDGDLLQRPTENGLANRAAGLGEGIDRTARRDVTGGEMDFRHPPVVSG